jgi:hypothetical protein
VPASAVVIERQVRKDATPAELIAEELARWLGPNTARTAVRTFARRALGLNAEELRPSDVPGVLDALRPMLNTLLGTERARSVLGTLARRFAP